MSNKKMTLRIAVSVISCGLCMLSIVGCATPTRVRVSNINQQQVIETLLEEGGDNFRKSFFRKFGDKEGVFPSIKTNGKLNGVIRYDAFGSTQIFSYGIDCKDTICISKEKSGSFAVSLLCKERDFMEWGLHRELRKERQILLRTTKQLQEAHGAVIEWFGSWRPTGEPIIVSKQNAKWIGFSGGSTKEITEYLTRTYPRYNKSKYSTRKHTLYERTLKKNPRSEVDFWKREDEVEKWESKERILVKTVPPCSDEEEDIIVVGVNANGIHYEKKAVFRILFARGAAQTFYTDVSEKLVDGVIDGICEKVIFEVDRLEFVDPTPWIEDIELPSLETDFAKEGIDRLRQTEVRE